MARMALVMLMTQAGGAAVAFFIQVVLAQELGAAGYGVYAYALAWVNVLAYLSLAGHDVLMLREVAVLTRDAAWSRLRGLIAYGRTAALAGGAAAALVMVALGPLMPDRTGDAYRLALMLAAPIVPMIAVTRLHSAMCTGFGRPVVGQLAERLGRDVPLLAVLSGLAWAAMPLEPTQALLLMLAAATLGTIVSAATVERVRPGKGGDRPRDASPALWMRAAVAMGALAAFQLLVQRADLLILGWLGDATAPGIYAAVVAMTEITNLPLSALMSIAAPAIARHHAARQHAELQTVTSRATLLAIAGSALMCLPLIAVPDLLLRLYGAEFVDGAAAMRILAAGHFLRLCLGLPLFLLTMTGREWDALWAFAATTVLTIALNLALIPRLGLEGAAVASAVSMVAAYGWMTWRAYRRLGVVPLALGDILTLLGPRRRPAVTKANTTKDD